MNRQRFLQALGVGMVAPTALLAQREERKRPSFWNFLFTNHETAPARHRPDPKNWNDDTITAAWIGHSTVLINFFGTWIITDPVLSECIGLYFPGLFTLGPKRLVAPAMPFDELPPIDLILLSHAHYDHLDLPTLRRFKPEIPIIMAKNTSCIITLLRKKNVQELDWGESIDVAGVRVEALRVKHFGWRFPWESDRSKGNWEGRSYNAYLVAKNGRHLLFGGDTAYCEYFKQVGERGIEVDLAMMPIGAYDPWIRMHANPEQAVKMASHVRAKHFLPIHFATFVQSSEPIDEPLQRLKRALASHSPALALEEIGQTWRMG